MYLLAFIVFQIKINLYILTIYSFEVFSLLTTIFQPFGKPCKNEHFKEKQMTTEAIYFY